MKIIYSKWPLQNCSPGVRLHISSVGPLDWRVHTAKEGLWTWPSPRAATPCSTQLPEASHIQRSRDGKPQVFAQEPLPWESWGSRRKPDCSRIIWDTTGLSGGTPAATQHRHLDRWPCVSFTLLPSFPVHSGCRRMGRRVLGSILNHRHSTHICLTWSFCNSTKGGNRRSEANKQSHRRGEGRRETKTVFSYTRRQLEQLSPWGPPSWWAARTQHCVLSGGPLHRLCLCDFISWALIVTRIHSHCGTYSK